MELNIMRLLAEKHEANEEVALITVISSDGVKHCNTGTMMVVDKKGEVLCGRVGSSLLQEEAKSQAKICIQRGLSRKVLLGSEDSPIEVFINAFCNRERLLIAGAGNVSLNIYKIARILGYSITVVDNRAENLTKERFPEADELLLGDIAEMLSSCPINENTNIVIATHHHESDEPALKAVISSPARYIGMIGNIRKVTALLNNLRTLNIPEELISKVHSPVGLDLGGQMTAEIALAVVAEIQAIKYQRTGGFIGRALIE